METNFLLYIVSPSLHRKSDYYLQGGGSKALQKQAFHNFTIFHRQV